MPGTIGNTVRVSVDPRFTEERLKHREVRYLVQGHLAVQAYILPTKHMMVVEAIGLPHVCSWSVPQVSVYAVPSPFIALVNTEFFTD